ncbi:carbohydrate porin [Pseudomonas sp. HR96]|uniref:carbohydrate porin n=1 Tax=Pseudomonas sp. HR96 TaxID=1027966 RepID=UPI002A75431D|nr:carbohydrate porin [Pseudomonas sp. HR96]WPP01946.1 carbohydrate porin [Pseudomonas sp. HR96]
MSFPAPRTLRLGATTSLMLGLCSASLAVHADEPTQGMTGDWGGLRSAWLAQGIQVQGDYTGESSSNLRGGYDKRHTTRYADQFTLGVGLDLEKLLGWQDTQFMLQVANRNGDSLNDKRLDDPRGESFADTQEVYGGGSVTRLSELWLSKGWLDKRLELKAGRFAFGDEFAVQDCQFQNLALCDSQTGNWMDSAYNGPVSTWAARLKYALGDQLYVQAGVFAVNPSYLANDNGFKLAGSGTEGSLLPLEVVWTPSVAGLPGEYHAGYYYSTAKVDDLYKDESNQPAAVTADDYRRDSSRHGWWLIGKQQLTTVDGNASRGLVLTASVAAYDAATTPVQSYQSLGLVFKGPFAARPDDTLGLGVARLQASRQFLRNARAANAVGGSSYADDDYLPEQHSEYNIELNYGVQVTDWLSVRPNLQYVAHPGGVREVQNAVVAGLQVQSTF